MTEATEPEILNKTINYSPKGTHRNWTEKAARLIDFTVATGGTAAMYAASVMSAINAGIYLEKSESLQSTLQTVQSLAEQVGGTVSPESIRQIMELAKTNEVGAILYLTVAGTFFVAGTLSTATTSLRATHK